MKTLLPELKARGIRVIANAGGVNPLACRDALARVAEAAGIALRIGVVLGDDLSAQADALRAAGVTEMYSGAPFPPRLASVTSFTFDGDRIVGVEYHEPAADLVPAKKSKVLFRPGS